MARPRPSPTRARHTNGLAELAVRACLIATDATLNAKEFLNDSARLAYLAVRDCEQELDRIEQQIDEQLPSAIAEVNESEARELLACLRFSTDLERIGDLMWGVVQRAQNLDTKLPKADLQQLTQMLDVIEKMLQHVRQGFVDRDLEAASFVLRSDREINQIYKLLFRRYVQNDTKDVKHCADAFLMAQALERAGDHATNLAEELFRLIEGRSLRHAPKKKLKD